jgi:hypothetical protein
MQSAAQSSTASAQQPTAVVCTEQQRRSLIELMERLQKPHPTGGNDDSQGQDCDSYKSKQRL